MAPCEISLQKELVQNLCGAQSDGGTNSYWSEIYRGTIKDTAIYFNLIRFLQKWIPLIIFPNCQFLTSYHNQKYQLKKKKKKHNQKQPFHFFLIPSGVFFFSKIPKMSLLCPSHIKWSMHADTFYWTRKKGCFKPKNARAFCSGSLHISTIIVWIIVSLLLSFLEIR